MARKPADSKTETLRACGCLNPHPDRVTDPTFVGDEFFDARDLVQVKYEMLRRVRIDGVPVAMAAATFGFSRPSFYKAQACFEQRGMDGLVPGKRGPRSAHKLSDEVVDFVEHKRGSPEAPGIGELVSLVKERFGRDVHPRSLERALARREKKRQRAAIAPGSRQR